MTKELVAKRKASLAISTPALAIVSASGPDASRRFLEFFAVSIRNPNTRRAYFRAACHFFNWCEQQWSLPNLSKVQPVHVAAFVEKRMREVTKPSVKQELASIKMLFDWLVVGQIVPSNPASSVRGPKHSVKKGKTPVLSAEEMRTLLDSIPVADKKGKPKLIGLRDRALIALMGYTFARIGAVLTMKVEDYYIQKRRGWVRLHEKGGKVNELPCHHNLEIFLDEWLSVSGLSAEPTSPLFPALNHGVFGTPRLPIAQADAWSIIQRRRIAAGIETKIGNHSFRATGITTYLKNGGKLEIAQQMAGHESARTTGLYDRRDDAVQLDEIEKVVY